MLLLREYNFKLGVNGLMSTNVNCPVIISKILYIIFSFFEI